MLVNLLRIKYKLMFNFFVLAILFYSTEHCWSLHDMGPSGANFGCMASVIYVGGPITLVSIIFNLFWGMEISKKWNGDSFSLRVFIANLILYLIYITLIYLF